jgi:hypothetical protein
MRAPQFGQQARVEHAQSAHARALDLRVVVDDGDGFEL